MVFYKRDRYGNMNVIYVDKSYVGRLTVTKMIGSNDYNDISDFYRYAKSKLFGSFIFMIITVLTGYFFNGND